MVGTVPARLTRGRNHNPPPVTSIELRLFTDASDLGLGCVFGTHWVSSGRAEGWHPSPICHINVRELFAVWAAVFTWGHRWANKEIVIFSDNKSTVQVWTSGSCTDSRMMAVIRAIFYRAAKTNTNIILEYVPGPENVNADLLSRFQVEEFLNLNPDADQTPTLDGTWMGRPKLQKRTSPHQITCPQHSDHVQHWNQTIPPILHLP